MLLVLDELTISEVAFLASDLLAYQALNLVLLTTLNRLYLQLKTLHTSHSMLALISSFPSAMKLLMIKF